ncbi:MAG: hypothetical protein SPE43_01740 [Ruminococcus sp.]|nr:hypothetical protein [Ruminococcus sp.]
MIFSAYQIVFFFFIYAFLGWCTEVIYACVNSGKFVNRGFLNGPYCPIYGFGVVAVVMCIYPVKDNLPVLFFGSVILTTALEFVTGFILEKIFNEKWWDYSDEHFNIKGYICLKFSLMWGLACIIVVRVIHPIIIKFVDFVPRLIGIIIISVLSAGILSDIIITVLAIMKIKKNIRLIQSISDEMRNISDFTGEKIYDKVSTIMEKNEEYKEKISEKCQHLEEIKEKYKNITESKGIINKRIENAFPKLKINTRKTFRELIEEIKSNKE